MLPVTFETISADIVYGEHQKTGIVPIQVIVPIRSIVDGHCHGNKLFY